MTRRTFAAWPIALVAAYWLALACWLWLPGVVRAVLAEMHLFTQDMGGLRCRTTRFSA